MTPIIPRGKGVMLWQLDNCKPQPMSSLVGALDLNGFDWVAPKICDGTLRYNQSLLVDFTQACSLAHIAVYPWVYTYGPVQGGLEGVRTEARLALQVMNELGLYVLLIDAEKEYKRGGAASFAREYLKTLRGGGSHLTLGLCSYRFPHVHPEFPWGVFAETMDFYAPQLYWVDAHNSDEQMRMSVLEYTGLGGKPIIPIGSTYTEHGWGPDPAEIAAFQEQVHRSKLQGVGWWAWDDHGLQEHPAWLGVISRDVWVAPPVDPPPPPTPAELLEQRVDRVERFLDTKYLAEWRAFE